nr:unnamed protein product [Callosobruchus chinensis]
MYYLGQHLQQILRFLNYT